MSWLTAHWAVLALVVKSALDLAFAIKPGLDAPGGVVDYIYQQLKKLLGS